MVRRRRRTWPDFSPCNSTNQDVKPTSVSALSEFEDNDSYLCNSSTKTFTNSELTGRRRDSSGSCPAWSMSSLMAILPVSPSPICSSTSPLSPRSCSPSSDLFYSQVSTQFSTPRNQSSCTMSNDDKISTSSIEIDKEIENVTYPCSLYQLNLKSNVPRDCEAMEQEYSPKWLSSSPIYESDNAGIDYAIPSMPLLVVIEEEDDEKSQVESGDSRYEDSDTGSPIHGHRRLMNRPKPYHAFLGEIRRKELETEVNAWKEAKHLKLMNELRRKEAAINAWEFKQTRKALNDMKKLENKLETKRVNAIEKSQKKIRLTQRKADKKKVRERRYTVNKISILTKIADKIRATKCLIWLRLMKLW